MTRQLGSALAGERPGIAREIHDAISQHLFGLRMIAAGMRKAKPDNEQVQAVERVTEEALRESRYYCSSGHARQLTVSLSLHLRPLPPVEHPRGPDLTGV